MMTISRLLSFGVAAALILNNSYGAQGGDTCDSAQVIAGPGTWTFDGPGTEYFEWTPLITGSYRFKVSEPGGQTKDISFRSGSGCSGTLLASSELPNSEGQESIEVTGILVGDTLTIAISEDGSNGMNMPGTLEVIRQGGLDPIAGCSTPLAISGTGTFTFQDLYAQHQPIDPQVLYWSLVDVNSTDTTLDVLNPFNDHDPMIPDCPQQGLQIIAPGDGIFLWQAPESTGYRIRAFRAFMPQCPSTYAEGEILAFHYSDCRSLTCMGYQRNYDPFIGIFDAELTFGATAGDTFLFVVDSDCDFTITTSIDESLCHEVAEFEVSCVPPNPHHEHERVQLTGSFLDCESALLHVDAFDGPGGEFGYFLMGTGAGQNILAFEGLLCLDNPIGRYNANAATALGNPAMNSIGMFEHASGRFLNTAGTALSGFGFDVPLTLPNPPGPGSIIPGDTWHFQLWYRDKDALGQGSSNFSYALGVTFP